MVSALGGRGFGLQAEVFFFRDFGSKNRRPEDHHHEEPTISRNSHHPPAAALQ